MRGTTKPPDAFFVRSETLYTLATALKEASLDALKHDGDKSLHERPPGGARMVLVMNRLSLCFFLFHGPEAGPPPIRQLAFLAAMHQLVRQGSQLVIAAHPPILLAYRDSLIYELAYGRFAQRAYEETTIIE